MEYKPDIPLAFVLDVSASIAEIEVGNLVGRNAFRFALSLPQSEARSWQTMIEFLAEVLE